MIHSNTPCGHSTTPLEGPSARPPVFRCFCPDSLCSRRSDEIHRQPPSQRATYSNWTMSATASASSAVTVGVAMRCNAVPASQTAMTLARRLARPTWRYYASRPPRMPQMNSHQPRGSNNRATAMITGSGACGRSIAARFLVRSYQSAGRSVVPARIPRHYTTLVCCWHRRGHGHLSCSGCCWN